MVHDGRSLQIIRGPRPPSQRWPKLVFGRVDERIGGGDTFDCQRCFDNASVWSREGSFSPPVAPQLSRRKTPLTTVWKESCALFWKRQKRFRSVLNAVLWLPPFTNLPTIRETSFNPQPFRLLLLRRLRFLLPLSARWCPTLTWVRPPPSGEEHSLST